MFEAILNTITDKETFLHDMLEVIEEYKRNLLNCEYHGLKTLAVKFLYLEENIPVEFEHHEYVQQFHDIMNTQSLITRLSNVNHKITLKLDEIQGGNNTE